MAESNSEAQPTLAPRTFGHAAKRAGLFLLFGTILMIPRVRRLRRRVWAWTCVRLAAAACGGCVVWRYAHAQAGTALLAGGFILLAFGLLVAARPAVKSVDSIASDLGALIVLNGGTFQSSSDSAPTAHSQIFVHPEKAIVHAPGQRLLLEIPFAKVRSLTAHAVANGAGKPPEPWQVEIDWLADDPRPATVHTAVFHYDGVFAEHLAEVAESTLRGQWIKDLPVIHQ
jgi:hypothetical protein